MSGNLPDGCTQAMIDAHLDGDPEEHPYVHECQSCGWSWTCPKGCQQVDEFICRRCRWHLLVEEVERTSWDLSSLIQQNKIQMGEQAYQALKHRFHEQMKEANFLLKWDRESEGG